jgi:dTMP kinase
MSGRGRFVVFEGLDGAGTTTQMRLLSEHLLARGMNVEVTREPSNAPFGAVIRQAVEGRVSLHPIALALAFAGDRADHLTNEVNGIVFALERGAWVLCDRYVLSSLAYQASEEVNFDWLVDLNRFATTPDLTVFVDTLPEICFQRISTRSAHAELFHHLPELERVRANYRRALMVEKFVGQLVKIDGSADPQLVFEELLAGIGAWLDQPELIAA